MDASTLKASSHFHIHNNRQLSLLHSHIYASSRFLRAKPLPLSHISSPLKLQSQLRFRDSLGLHKCRAFSSSASLLISDFNLVAFAVTATAFALLFRVQRNYFRFAYFGGNFEEYYEEESAKEDKLHLNYQCFCINAENSQLNNISLHPKKGSSVIVNGKNQSEVTIDAVIDSNGASLTEIQDTKSETVHTDINDLASENSVYKASEDVKEESNTYAGGFARTKEGYINDSPLRSNQMDFDVDTNCYASRESKALERHPLSDKVTNKLDIGSLEKTKDVPNDQQEIDQRQSSAKVHFINKTALQNAEAKFRNPILIESYRMMSNDRSRKQKKNHALHDSLVNLNANLKDLLPIDSTKDASEYLSYYNYWLRVGRLKNCIALLENMKKSGCLDMDKVYHAKFFDVSKKKKAIKEALRFVKLIENPTLSTFNMLLSVCASTENAEEAFQVFSFVYQAGLKPDLRLYTALISCCAKASKIDIMFKVFHEMINLGIEPSIQTYGSLIDGCARTGQVAKAFGVYGIMRSKNVKPDRIIFNALITACGRSGAVDRAFDVFSEMRADPHPLYPDHVTIGALLNVCLQSGQLERALEVYKMVEEYNIKGTPDVYTMAISVCGQIGNIDLAVKILHDMKRKDVRPDEMLYSALIDAAGHAGKLEFAFECLHDAKREGIRPGNIIYSSLMGACRNTKNWEKAMELYEELKGAGIIPTVSTINALITSFCDAGKLQESITILEEMKQKTVLPNNITYIILLMACEREDEPELAIKLFSRALSDGVTPSLVMCNCVIGLCLRRYQHDSVLSATIQRDETGNMQIHNQWTSQALLTYRQAISVGVKPTKETLSQLLGCFRIPVNVLQEDPFNESHKEELDIPIMTEGFGIYDTHVFSLYEEAASLGVVPCFKYRDIFVVIDVKEMEIYVAEVYLLTVFKGLKHRFAAGARIPNIIIRLPVEEITAKSMNGEKLISASGRTGQAVASLLRRLNLPYFGKEAHGKIRISEIILRQWLSPKPYAPSFKFRARALTSSNTDLHLGRSIRHQQRIIRSGDFSIDHS